MPADLVVTNLSGSPTDAGSLGAELALAADGDTISFASDLNGGAIDLAATLVITKNVTIEGHIGGGMGAANITLDGDAALTPMDIAAGATVAVDGLHIIDGYSAGSAGANGAPATAYTGGAGGAAAGGIFDSGVLFVTNTAFTDDIAVGGGGGSGANGTVSGGGGGGGGNAAGAIYVAASGTLALGLGTVSFTGDLAEGGLGGYGGNGGAYSGAPGVGAGPDTTGIAGGKGAGPDGGAGGTAGTDDGPAGPGGRASGPGGGGSGGSGAGIASFGGAGVTDELIVTSLSGSASVAGSLGYELAQATNGDAIVFAADLSGGTIDLAATLVISKNVTIEGHIGGGTGAADISLSGGGTLTVMDITSGATVALDGLNIIDGNGTGAPALFSSSGGPAAGGIFDSGVLRVTDASFAGDTASGAAGGDGPAGDGAPGSAGGNAAGGIYLAPGASLALGIGNVSFSGDIGTGGAGGTGATGGPGLAPGDPSGAPGGAGGAGGVDTLGQPGQAGTGPNAGAGGAPGQAGGMGIAGSGGGGGGGGTGFANYGGAGVLEQLTVTSLSGSASVAGSLGYELAQAVNGDAIVFAADLSGGTIDLAATLVIAKNVTIEGHVGGGTGTADISLSGGGARTVLDIATGATVALDGLNIVDGSGTGTMALSSSGPGGAAAGGIFDSGVLSVADANFSGDTASGGTGGAGLPGNGGAGGAGGNAAGAIYLAAGASLTLGSGNVSFSDDAGTGGTGGVGGTGALSIIEGDPSGAPGGAGGAGGTNAVGVAGQSGTGPNAGAGGAPDKAGGTGSSGSGGGGGGGGTGFADYGGAGTSEVPCFCRGTCILTPSGEVAVEGLKVGDLVATLAGPAQPIVWIGHGRVPVARGQRCAATPVIVSKGALADNLPHRDLRLTKGHSLLLDGALIPVEVMVNHRSIRWDDRAQEVEFYHIELATHAVLFAEGAPAESFRDDGNRLLFHNADSGWGAPAMPPCAPVLTGGALVDAVWQRLLDRAGPRPGLPLTEAADLHLLVDGRRLDGSQQPDGWHSFALPSRATDVRVASRAGSPAELGLARDQRMLGVAVRQVRLWQGARLRVLEASDASLDSGFHAFEPSNGWRWTSGDARLPAALFDGVDGACKVELLFGATMRYPLFTDGPGRVAA